MTILHGDAPVAWFSGDCMRHIALDGCQPVDYFSPGNGLTNHLVAGVISTLVIDFCCMLHVCLGTRGGPDVKFHSGTWVKLRDILLILPWSAVLSSSKSCLHARTFTLFLFS